MLLCEFVIEERAIYVFGNFIHLAAGLVEDDVLIDVSEDGLPVEDLFADVEDDWAHSVVFAFDETALVEDVA